MSDIEQNQRSKKIELLVGYFFSFSLIIIVIFAFLMFFRSKWFFLQNNYIAYYEYGNDIKPGTVVTLNGIVVGEVKRVSIDQPDKIKVSLSVWKKYKKWIRSDSVAKIERPLLVGNKQINISPGSQSAVILKPASIIKSEESSELVDLVSGKSLQKLLDNMGMNPNIDDSSVIDKITVRDIYDNAIASLVTLNEFQKSMKEMNVSFNRFTDRMDDLSYGMNEMGNSFSEMKQLYDAMDGMNDNLKSMSKGFNSMSRGLNNFEPVTEKLTPILDELDILLKAMQKNPMFKKEVKQVIRENKNEDE